jgi:hypothetical protein
MQCTCSHTILCLWDCAAAEEVSTSLVECAEVRQHDRRRGGGGDQRQHAGQEAERLRHVSLGIVQI